MSATTITYRGLCGVRITLNVDTTDSLTDITDAAIADEGFASNYYADFFLLRDDSIKRTTDGSSTYADLGLTTADELIAVLDDDPTTFTKEQRQVRKLEIAQLKRQGGPAGDTSANFYRNNNTYDITSLPDTYNANVPGADDNPNTGGLLPKRPWVAVGALAAPTSIGESVDGGTLVDLQVWYDGADTNTYVPNATDEGQITQWTDKSDFAHNANPSGGSAKPTYENTVLQGGNGYLEFDGNDQLSVNPFTQLSGASAFTIFVVSNVLTASGAEYFTDTNTADFGMYSDGGTVKLTMNGYTRTTNATVSANAWHQHTLIYSGSGTPSLTYRLNRTTAGTSASTGSIPATTGAAGTFYIGNNSARSSGISGYIAEVILFNKTLSATEYGNVENYLKIKWGL
jgi:hypothetical protein